MSVTEGITARSHAGAEGSWTGGVAGAGRAAGSGCVPVWLLAVILRNSAET